MKSLITVLAFSVFLFADCRDLRYDRDVYLCNLGIEYWDIISSCNGEHITDVEFDKRYPQYAKYPKKTYYQETGDIARLAEETPNNSRLDDWTGRADWWRKLVIVELDTNDFYIYKGYIKSKFSQ